MLSILLPSDPGILWRLGTISARAVAPGLGNLIRLFDGARAHQSYYNLVAFIQHYFEDVRTIWWPSRLPLADITSFTLPTFRYDDADHLRAVFLLRRWLAAGRIISKTITLRNIGMNDLVSDPGTPERIR